MVLMLAVLALFLPLVLALVVYDVRWIVLSLRAGKFPPWGTYMRLFAAVCCHGGALILVAHGRDWPAKTLDFWMHMSFDPGLTFYAIGLWELYGRIQKRGLAGRGNGGAA